MARAEAASALASLRGAACADVLLPLLDDSSTIVSRIVRTSLRAERIPTPDTSSDVAVSARTPSFRRSGFRRRAASSSEAFLQRIDELSRPDRFVIGRSLLKSGRDREALLAGLADAMLEPRPSSRRRLAVLDLVGRLDLAHCLRDELFVLCGGTDRRIAATALRMLRRVNGAERIRVIRAALLSRDDRVRANAVEAMAGFDGDAWKDRAHVLELLTQDADSRTRANAVRILLMGRSPRAGSALKRMLLDPRPRHRISALWAAGSARAAHAAAVLRRVAEEDPIPFVRTRAEGVLAALCSSPASSPGQPFGRIGPAKAPSP
jgi:hypothetical protein